MDKCALKIYKSFIKAINHTSVSSIAVWIFNFKDTINYIPILSTICTSCDVFY